MKTTRKSVNVDTNYSVLCIIKNGAFDLGFINDIYVISNALFFNRWKMDPGANNRDIFMHAPSQWETTLQYNVVSHWLGWVHIQIDPCTGTVLPANTILVNIDGLHIWPVLQMSVGFHKTSLHYTLTGPWLDWYILKENIEAPYYWPFVTGICRERVDSLHIATINVESVPCHDIIITHL